MKYFKSKLFLGLAALGLCAFALNAPAQVTNGINITVTNMPAVVTTTATSNFVSWVKVKNASGLSASWRFNQATASTSNATLNVYFSADGTTNTISTVPFAQLSAASTGATDVIVNTNWSDKQLAGIDSLIIGGIANTTALTTLTNKGVIIRRTPN